MENSVGQLPNQVVRNRANSSGQESAHMEYTEKILIINIVGWIFSGLVWNRPSSSGKVPAHRHKTETEKMWASPSTSSSATGPSHLERGQLI